MRFLGYMRKECLENLTFTGHNQDKRIRVTLNNWLNKFVGEQKQRMVLKRQKLLRGTKKEKCGEPQSLISLKNMAYKKEVWFVTEGYIILKHVFWPYYIIWWLFHRPSS